MLPNFSVIKFQESGGRTVLNYLGILAAVTGLVSTDIDMNNVPIEYGTVASAQMRVAFSASVRAATWDDLPFKPSNPVNVRLACIVLGSVDKFEPVSSGGEMDHAKEAIGKLVVAGGDGPVDLEMAEHALDAVRCL